MNNKVYFLAIVLLSLLVSCSSSNRSGKNEEVVFDDGNKIAAGEVVIDDKSFEGKNEPFAASSKASREITQIAKDGSQINVAYDGYGNKTETRTFNNNPLLKLILLRTGTDGSRQVFVYGQNGEVKSLPENMLDKILTAPPNELASSAGISEDFKQPTSEAQNTQLNTATLKPLPSSQFPIQNQQVEQTPPKETEQPADTAEKTTSDDGNSHLLEKKETATLNKSPASNDAQSRNLSSTNSYFTTH